MSGSQYRRPCGLGAVRRTNACSSTTPTSRGGVPEHDRCICREVKEVNGAVGGYRNLDGSVAGECSA
jgi:hypothetical protein